MKILLCNFEPSKETNTPHHRETHRRHELILHKHIFEDRAQHNEEVKSVEE